MLPPWGGEMTEPGESSCYRVRMEELVLQPPFTPELRRLEVVPWDLDGSSVHNRRSPRREGMPDAGVKGAPIRRRAAI